MRKFSPTRQVQNFLWTIFLEYLMQTVMAISLLRYGRTVGGFDPVSCLAQEFLVATDMTTAGSPEEKARWTFKMFDRDRCDVDMYVISTMYLQYLCNI